MYFMVSVGRDIMKKTGFEMGHDVKNRWPALTGCGASVLQSGCVPVNCANRAGAQLSRGQALPGPKRRVSGEGQRGRQEKGGPP